MKPDIQRATPDRAREIAVLVGEFQAEIISAIGSGGFRFRLAEAVSERGDFLAWDEYVVLIARSPRGHPLGFITLFEHQAHHLGDPFGMVAELYVRPEYRRRRIGRRLIEQAKSLARSRRWKHLQLAMPALGQLGDALTFFERERFVNAGGSKMTLVL